MLENRWNLNKAMLMYKVVHNFVPMYLSSQFFGRDTVHEYNITGNHVNLCIPKPNTNFLKSSLIYGGAAAWNPLSDEIKTSENIAVFKNKIKTVKL